MTARIEAQPERSLCSNLHNIASPAKNFIPTFATVVCGDRMAAGAGPVLYRGMDREKSLDRAGGAETLHLSFSSSDRNAGTFDPAVLPLRSAMPSREAELTNGRCVGPQLVRDQRAGRKSLSLQKPPGEFTGVPSHGNAGGSSNSLNIGTGNFFSRTGNYLVDQGTVARVSRSFKSEARNRLYLLIFAAGLPKNR